MENIVGFVLIIFSLIINFFAVIILSYVSIYLMIHVWRAREFNSLLVINTYIPILLASVAHMGLNIRAILNDTLVLVSDDSIICHVWGYIYLYIILWLYSSFSVQAYIRMLAIMYPHRTYLHSFMKIMIFIIFTWFITLLLLLPTIFLNAIIYEVAEYQCVVNLRTWKGNIYMILTFYSIPITITATVYLCVVRFIKASTLRSQRNRYITVMRDVRVLRHIVILVCILVTLGLPSAVFWINGLITGYLHPLTYRIQALSIAITMLILTIAVPLTNPQVKRLLPILNRQNVTPIQYMSQQQQMTYTITRQ